jgi:transcription elongation GreA/GreB family factor
MEATTMSTDKIDPSKKDATISSADELVKTTQSGDVELSEEELKRVTGGTTIKFTTTTKGKTETY